MKIEEAIQIAISAHKGQVDKAGQPYILHPLRVMMRMDTEDDRVVAVLHDVLEDSDWTPSKLEEAGVSQDILAALEHLTRAKDNESYDQFITRVMKNPTAMRIKKADLLDNMDLSRLPKIEDQDLERNQKYAKAYKRLTSVATPRFLDALDYAVHLHGTDVRKGTSIPYIAHLLGVCALVLLDGGTEDEAIAALLHDALEDHPGETNREMIAKRFGDTVLAIVEACTDTPAGYTGGDKPPWRPRKEAYLKHLGKATPGQLRVSLADKLDNARSVLADYRQIGEPLWKRFNAGKQDQLWFFRSLSEVFSAACAQGSLLLEFKRTVSELEREVGTA